MAGASPQRLYLNYDIFQVVEVNGINVEGKTPNDVLMILKMAENTITFKLIPNETKVSPRESRDAVRETLVLMGFIHHVVI